MFAKKLKVLNTNFKKPISCLATYSPTISKILDGKIDIILVGDSLGSTLYGMTNTQGVTLSMMMNHGYSVIKNIKKSITVIDMPFKTYENKYQALKNAKKLLNFSNANLIKIEIDKKKLSILKHLTTKDINTIAHIGVTPQNYKDFKKIKVIGRTNSERKKLIELAKKSEEYGAKAILLECVTAQTSKLISSSVSIPTIGIGASKHCDGQILVFDDLVNLTTNIKKPKFVKNYFNFNKLSKQAIMRFNNDVKKGKFPTKKYSYT